MNLKYLFIIIIIIILGFAIWMLVPKEINTEDVQIEKSNQEVEIIYPNGGEVLEYGESYMIQWTNPNQKRILIELYKDDERIDGIVISKTEGIQWDIINLKFPEIYQGDRFKLQILDDNTYKVLDESDDYFSIEIPKEYTEEMNQETYKSDYQDYKNDKYGFEFEYPIELTLEDNSSINIYSSKSLCETDGYGFEIETIEASALNLEIIKHLGTSYDQIWEDVFGFSSDYYDGIKDIGGKQAKYFSQGAEMIFGRTAYLVKLSETEALEINTYIPILVYNCDPQLMISGNDIYSVYDKILSTIIFLD